MSRLRPARGSRSTPGGPDGRACPRRPSSSRWCGSGQAATSSSSRARLAWRWGAAARNGIAPALGQDELLFCLSQQSVVTERRLVPPPGRRARLARRRRRRGSSSRSSTCASSQAAALTGTSCGSASTRPAQARGNDAERLRRVRFLHNAYVSPPSAEGFESTTRYRTCDAKARVKRIDVRASASRFGARTPYRVENGGNHGRRSSTVITSTFFASGRE